MTTKAQLFMTAAKLAGNVARERVLPAKATTLDEIPPSADALTREWLTAALCRDVPGAAVDAFEVIGGSDGTSSRRALCVGYNEKGRAAELPTYLFMKSASSFQSRLMLVAGGVTESETIFYRDIRPLLDGLRSPRSFYAMGTATGAQSPKALSTAARISSGARSPTTTSTVRSDGSIPRGISR